MAGRVHPDTATAQASDRTTSWDLPDGVTLHHDDCLNVLRAMPDASVDSIITDPPYGLANHKPKVVTDALVAWAQGDRERVPDGAGFMSRQWDRFVPPPAVWDECLRVLKPGGHLAVFAGSRTVDLMGLSIRLAGFELRDSLAAWLYGSGFPKSLDVGKAIDKAAPRAGMFDAFAAHLAERREAQSMTQKAVAQHFPSKTGGLTGCVWNWENGANVPTPEQWSVLARVLDLSDQWLPLIERVEAERKVVGSKLGRPGYADTATTGRMLPGQETGAAEGYLNVTAPATEAAREWQGWGTALKPAHEPILLARKPLDGTVASNVLAHGTGGINIDACRIGMSAADREVVDARSGGEDQQRGEVWNDGAGGRPPGERFTSAPGGRWPTNVLLAHHAECVEVGAREVKTDVAVNRNRRGTKYTAPSAYGERTEIERPDITYGVNGRETIPAFRCHIDCHVRALDEQSGTTRDGVAVNRNRGPRSVSTVNYADHDGRDHGYGGEGGASRFFPTFRYQAKAPASERPKVDGQGWPTVKPLTLLQWLCRLLIPQGGTVLDPFSGSGTTLQAAYREGFTAIGIEADDLACRLIEARFADEAAPADAPLTLFDGEAS